MPVEAVEPVEDAQSGALAMSAERAGHTQSGEANAEAVRVRVCGQAKLDGKALPSPPPRGMSDPWDAMPPDAPPPVKFGPPTPPVRAQAQAGVSNLWDAMPPDTPPPVKFGPPTPPVRMAKAKAKAMTQRQVPKPAHLHVIRAPPADSDASELVSFFCAEVHLLFLKMPWFKATDADESLTKREVELHVNMYWDDARLRVGVVKRDGSNDIVFGPVFETRGEGEDYQGVSDHEDDISMGESESSGATLIMTGAGPPRSESIFCATTNARSTGPASSHQN